MVNSVVSGLTVENKVFEIAGEETAVVAGKVVIFSGVTVDVKVVVMVGTTFPEEKRTVEGGGGASVVVSVIVVINCSCTFGSFDMVDDVIVMIEKAEDVCLGDEASLTGSELVD